MATLTATVSAAVVSKAMQSITSTSSATTATSTHRVTSDSGVLQGANPIVYNASNPILLFIVQAAIIIIFCRILHYPLRHLGQPRVIAEVIGGILLGPSVMMRIPGFKENIFPTASMPILNNIANLGLILFLFLTGLEVDLRMFLHNWRVAVSVAVASMVLPFGLGYAIAWGLYKQFSNEEGTNPITFGVFGLFIGTALAITAFPVLCRILTELKLLSNIVGVTTLAAGVGNDIVGWILLALCVALVNNTSGLAALWALLCTVGWALLLVFGVRPVFVWVLRRSGSLQNGPSEGMVCVTLLLVLVSAWFTGIIGVHPIFGGFLVGLICPHDGGFAIKLTEKIEDFLSAFFLPLYFALSGLSTNLGLLNNGITWAYVVGVIAVAFAGKITGGMLSARANKMFWRESLAIGVLMSCKGLVELIVLNIGLQAKILSDRTFTMFVVMALVTTVTTTPLTKLVYPLSYRQKVDKYRRGEIDWDGNPTGSPVSSIRQSFDKLNQSQIQRLLVYLRLDSLPGLFTFISLLGGPDGSAATVAVPKQGTDGVPVPEQRRHLEVHGLHILEITERTSSVMKVTEADELARRDPVVNTFRTFSNLHGVAVSGQVAVVPSSSYSETLVTEANETSSDFVLIPWGERGLMAEGQSMSVFASSSGSNRFDDRAYVDFVHASLENAVCNTGIFIDNGFGGAAPARPERPRLMRSLSVMSTHSQRDAVTFPAANKNHRVFLPFFGGADDRAALHFVLQLTKNKNISLTIAHFSWGDEFTGEGASHVPDEPSLSATTTAAEPTKTGKIGVGKDVVAANEPSALDLGLLSVIRSSLPDELSSRVTFEDVKIESSEPGTVIDEVMVRAGQLVGQGPRNAGDIVVLGRRHVRLGDQKPNAMTELSSSHGYDLAKTIGSVGARVVNANLKTSVLVIQASGRGSEP